MKTLLAVLLFIPTVALASDYSNASWGEQQKISKRICTDIMLDITRNYDVTELKLFEYHFFNSSVISCTYKAVSPGMYYDTPIMLGATFNTDNNRFTVEID